MRGGGVVVAWPASAWSLLNGGAIGAVMLYGIALGVPAYSLEAPATFRSSSTDKVVQSSCFVQASSSISRTIAFTELEVRLEHTGQGLLHRSTEVVGGMSRFAASTTGSAVVLGIIIFALTAFSFTVSLFATGKPCLDQPPVAKPTRTSPPTISRAPTQPTLHSQAQGNSALASQPCKTPRLAKSATVAQVFSPGTSPAHSPTAPAVQPQSSRGDWKTAAESHPALLGRVNPCLNVKQPLAASPRESEKSMCLGMLSARQTPRDDTGVSDADIRDLIVPEGCEAVMMVPIRSASQGAYSIMDTEGQGVFRVVPLTDRHDTSRSACTSNWRGAASTGIARKLLEFSVKTPSGDLLARCCSSRSTVGEASVPLPRSGLQAGSGAPTFQIMQRNGTLFATVSQNGAVNDALGYTLETVEGEQLKFSGDFRYHAVNTTDMSGKLVATTEMCTHVGHVGDCYRLRVGPVVNVGLVVCGLLCIWYDR